MAERVSDGSKVRIHTKHVDLLGARHSAPGHVDVRGKTRTGMVALGTLFTLLGSALFGFGVHGATSCRDCLSSQLLGVGGGASLAIGIPVLVIGAKPRDPELH